MKLRESFQPGSIKIAYPQGRFCVGSVKASCFLSPLVMSPNSDLKEHLSPHPPSPPHLHYKDIRVINLSPCLFIVFMDEAINWASYCEDGYCGTDTCPLANGLTTPIHLILATSQLSDGNDLQSLPILSELEPVMQRQKSCLPLSPVPGAVQSLSSRCLVR